MLNASIKVDVMEVITPMDDKKGLKEAIRESYAGAALSVKQPGGSAAKLANCCSGLSCCPGTKMVDFTGGAYSAQEMALVPADAQAASLGCGNPTALAELNPGETVLDLGSGGGIDVLLSARRVGPTGKAYGLDMTDEMLALARKNLAESGLSNVEFLKGDIEDIPLPDNAVDVVISNCVINLAGDKDQVLRETFRVLKPGGRFAVSDVVFQGDKGAVPPEVMLKVEAWAGCVAGALTEAEYIEKLAAAGFVDASVQVTHVYDAQTIEPWLGVDTWPEDKVRITSAFIRARKP